MEASVNQTTKTGKTPFSKTIGPQWKNPGEMPGHIFKKIIETEFDADKSTPKAICLIWEIDGYRLELSYDGRHDIEIEEACFFDGNEYVSYILNQEQMDELDTIAENYFEGYMDEVADSREYSRDIYAYHGMSRSDFI